jgi:hypothetical protein
MTAALRKAMPKLAIPRSAAWLGSIAPDIALYLLSFGAIAYFQYYLGWSRNETFQHMYGTLYFENAGWKAAHNLLQAPLVLLTGFGVARFIRDTRPSLCRWLTWFFAACSLHSLVDTLTHHDDGPLLLWPLNWSYRFSSPVSYWDRSHYGHEFARFELLFCMVLLAYLVLPWLAHRLANWGRKRYDPRPTTKQEESPREDQERTTD